MIQPPSMHKPVLERRVSLTLRPTPLEPMNRLAHYLRLPPDTLWVKRDDLTGLAGGGNKARKLEYLCAAAIAEGCDVLVTGGASQSNHVRMTAAAAAKLGLACIGVLMGDQSAKIEGNLILDYLLGATIVWADVHDFAALEHAISETCAQLRAEGRIPYRIPTGGASTIGNLGYVSAAMELQQEVHSDSIIVVADASGGTHAGLATGLGSFDRVLGVDCGGSTDLDAAVLRLAGEVAALVGLPSPTGTCQIDHDHYGSGYGATTDAAREALHLAAHYEGILLDPSYTAKAMAALITRIRRGEFDRGRQIVFLHTGGLPELFVNHYARWLID